MYTLVLSVHFLIAVVLVIAVLLQSGKGGGLGAGMGGGANTLFGSSGGSNFFTKLTTGLAIAFMFTSLGLTVMKGQERKSSIFDVNQTPATNQAPVGAPAQAPAEQPVK